MDTIAAEAGVTKKTLYDRFGSKDALIAAYLSARDEQWRAVVTEHLRRNHADPVDRAVAPFAVLGERDSVLTARQAARQPLDAAPRSVETP